ncbi:long-chain-alcohol oxidase FAO4A [Morus notabilis]|nr:long-chain-alcohol oxidase FAO4A [Morus notabilis]
MKEEKSRNDNNNVFNIYESSLSRRQMDTLIAVSDAFLPSVDVSDLTADESLLKFYATSASMAATPQRLGGMISERLKHPKKWLLKVALWALSTWFGTFVMCGIASVSTTFPYFHSFPNLSHQRRQEILNSWSQSYFFLLRLLYWSLKLLTFLVFFTQVDSKDHNVSWKAIGYTGPDPDFKVQNTTTAATTKLDEQQQQQQEILFGPLSSGIVDFKTLPHDLTLINTLKRHGFPVKRRRPCTSILPQERSTHNNKVPSSIFDPFLKIRCDAVVVGSGSGGGVVAGLLARAGYKVLVLEKGNYYARNNLTLLEGPTLDQMYLSNGLMATADMDVLLLAGSTVGGGSTINWSASIPTPQHVRKEWCDEYELELFGSKLYEEALDVVCKRMQVQSEIEEEGFNNAVLRKGCEELGYPVDNIPRNAPSDHYCGWCCLGCKDGRKKGTSETWLLDLVESGNGVILPGSEAVKVLHQRKSGRERNTATGVAFEFENSKGDKEICVVESRVTVVACGALRTPTLLKRSGLRNPNIGKNLHLHPVAMAWGYFPDNSSSFLAEKKSYEGGIMTAMSTVAADLKKSGYGTVIQTPALHPGMFSILMPWVSGKDMKDRMRRFSRTAHVFALARDQGSGTVNSDSEIRYSVEARDEEKLRAGVEKVLRILAAAGAEEIGTHHGKGKSINVKSASYHELERFVKEESGREMRGLRWPICSAHQMGSCRMGVAAATSAVNPMGETWEVEGLFVADTSVFPTALGVNPMVTVQAIAYCTALSVLQLLKRKKIKTTYI